ncbi:uncharacterized protein [Ptychodera flava]|uniref:uncharacterized protein n=1 Tax=Ptychodera flava TaxID=63121 RepID=UPI00396AA7FB
MAGAEKKMRGHVELSSIQLAITAYVCVPLKKIKKYIVSNVFSAANTHKVRYIAIDNKSRQNCQTSDAAVGELRQWIRELSTDDYFCDEVPVKWIHLELLLRKEKKDTLELQAAYKLGADLGLDTNEVHKALVYLHSVGEILHYDSLPELKETVIVNVCWLVNLFKVLITKAITCEDDLQADAPISVQAEALRGGILYETVVDDVLKKENRLNDKEIILKTMELYDILSEVPFKTPDAQHRAKYYVPCFLTKYLDDKEKIVVSRKSEPCCPIYFHFPGNFLPEGLFYRFIVRCLRKWPSESIPLYKNYARFFVRDKGFHFIVHRIGADIMLRALTQSENQQFHPTTFHDLRRTAEGELQHVVGTYAPGLSFDVCLKCSGENHKHEGLQPGSMDLDDGCVQIEEKDGTASAVCRILQDYVHPLNLKPWYFKASKMLFATPGVKPSEQPEEIQKKRARFSDRSLLVINDEWGTQKGGISTVNRLISGLAAEIGQVYATALKRNTEDIDDARRRGIKLILPKVLGDRSPDLDWLNTYYTLHFKEIKEIEDLEVIIGHQPVTSRAALNIRNEWFRSKKVILFNHVIPEDTDVHKDEWAPSTVQKKEDELCDHATDAKVVFSVGHRIYSHFQNKFRSHRSIIHELFIPSLMKVFLKSTYRNHYRQPKVQILTFGRVDGVQGLKGYDIAAAALGKVVEYFKNKNKPAHKIPVWKIRGIQQELDKQKEQEKAENIMKLINDGHLQSIPAPYATQKEIQKDLQQSHLCLMPSRNEPFGMVGMEAMAAGLPVLITSNSGLADLLKEHSPESYSEVIVETV